MDSFQIGAEHHYLFIVSVCLQCKSVPVAHTAECCAVLTLCLDQPTWVGCSVTSQLVQWEGILRPQQNLYCLCIYQFVELLTKA